MSCGLRIGCQPAGLDGALTERVTDTVRDGHASVTPYAVMTTARCVTGLVCDLTCVRVVSAGGFQLVCVWIVATAVLIALVRPFAPSGYLKLLRPIIRDFITATV